MSKHSVVVERYDNGDPLHIIEFEGKKCRICVYAMAAANVLKLAMIGGFIYLIFSVAKEI